MQRAVRARRLLVGQLLQVVRQDQRGDAALADRDAHRAVDQMADLRRHRGLLHEGAGDIAEQRRQIDFLLVMAAERRAGLLAADRQHRHVVEPRVVKSRDQMRGARSRGGDADAELAGELGVGRGHERRHFLMAGLDELDLALGALQRAEHAVDAVAGVAEDPAHAPLACSRSTMKSPTVWDMTLHSERAPFTGSTARLRLCSLFCQKLARKNSARGSKATGR